MNPQRWNGYSYALNDPIKFIDPDGQDVEIATNARSAAAYGYKHSSGFRAQFDAAKLNPLVQAKYVLVTSVTGARAEATYDVRGPLEETQDGRGNVISREKYSVVSVGAGKIPARGDAGTAAVLGHELAHVNNQAQTGPERRGQLSGERGEENAQSVENGIRDDFLDGSDDVCQGAVDNALQGTGPKPNPRGSSKGSSGGGFGYMTVPGFWGDQ